MSRVDLDTSEHERCSEVIATARRLQGDADRRVHGLEAERDQAREHAMRWSARYDNAHARVVELEDRVAELEAQNAELRRYGSPYVGASPSVGVDFGPGPHPRLDCCNGITGVAGACVRGTKGCSLPHADPRPSEATPERTYEDERGDVLVHLRNAAQRWRNRANDQPGTEPARAWLKRAEELGRLANEIERGAHVAGPRGNWRVVAARELVELRKKAREQRPNEAQRVSPSKTSAEAYRRQHAEMCRRALEYLNDPSRKDETGADAIGAVAHMLERAWDGGFENDLALPTGSKAT